MFMLLLVLLFQPQERVKLRIRKTDSGVRVPEFKSHYQLQEFKLFTQLPCASVERKLGCPTQIPLSGHTQLPGVLDADGSQLHKGYLFQKLWKIIPLLHCLFPRVVPHSSCLTDQSTKVAFFSMATLQCHSRSKTPQKIPLRLHFCKTCIFTWLQPLPEWFSNFRINQYHLEDQVNHRLLPNSQVSEPGFLSEI